MAKKSFAVVQDAWDIIERLFVEIFGQIDDSNIRVGAAIKGGKLAAGTVTATELAAGAVTNAKLAADAVTTDKILDGTIATADLADGAVTRLKFGEFVLLTFELPGTAFVGTTQAGILLPSGLDFLDLRVYSQTAPTGTSLIVNALLNGVAVVTSANRPTVAAAGNASNIVTAFATSGGVSGDRLTFDVDQVGSTIPGGNDLLIAMTCKERFS